VTFIDDASRFCYVHLLHTKDEALDKFKVFKTEKSPWGLFPENLNMGAEPNVLHP
jgi:hypothetical protein